MDYELDADQQDLVGSVSTLLARLAGTERARDVLDGAGYDAPLMRALIDAGFADPVESGATPLEAELVTELVAGAVGAVPFAARALVAPALLPAPRPDVVVVLDGLVTAPVRYAAHADLFLAPRGAGVVRIEPAEVEVTPVDSPFGYPQARVIGAESAGEPLLEASAGTLWAWSRCALAAELVGSMDAALLLTAAYVTARKQFGAPLGSLQAVQHRLAELYFRIDGARWLTRRAAGGGARPADAAAAATAATAAAARVVTDTHQLTGAMGLTREYDLFLWTLRIAALRQEAGGESSHAAALARARWNGTDPTSVAPVSVAGA